MKKLISIIILIFSLAALCPGKKTVKKNPVRPVHTYSIVARDQATGQLGVAVQSHWFSVGPLVPWIEAGIGAVATQSFVEVSYGPLGLSLMRAGKSAPQALKALIEVDSNKEVRQVAMIDNQGQVGAHTGKSCISEAGHLTGEQFSVQANLMLKNTVWKAMANAYESTKGDLTDRLLAALEAAENEGGDIRGRQSAAIIVVAGKPTGQSWRDRIVDLRVEDHPHPVEELKRLVKVHRAYEHMNKGDEYIAEENIEAALKEYSTAEQLAPDNIEMIFWHAVTLASLDRVGESLPLFKKVFEADYNWAILLPRLPKSGLLPDKPELIKKILSIAAERQSELIQPTEWWEKLPRPIYATLEKVETSQRWFEVYKLIEDTYAIYEPYQFEEAISYLVIGTEKAVVIDTGTGIGNLKKAVSELTQLPVSVVNTHTHWDHIGNNYQFEEIACYNNADCIKRLRMEIDNESLQRHITGDSIWKLLPEDFDPATWTIPSVNPTSLLEDGKLIDLGERVLEVIYTPGHSPGSICLLDKKNQILFTGDTFFPGPLYAYPADVNIDQYIASIEKLKSRLGEYDYLCSGHNDPWVKSEVIPRVGDAFQEIMAGKGNFKEDKGIRRYFFEGFDILIRADMIKK